MIAPYVTSQMRPLSFLPVWLFVLLLISITITPPGAILTDSGNHSQVNPQKQALGRMHCLYVPLKALSLMSLTLEELILIGDHHPKVNEVAQECASKPKDKTAPI